MENAVFANIRQYRREAAFLSFRCCLRYILQGQACTQGYSGVQMKQGSLWFQSGNGTEDIKVDAGTIIIETVLDPVLFSKEVQLLQGVREIKDNEPFLDLMLELLALDELERSEEEYLRLQSAYYGLMAKVQTYLANNLPKSEFSEQEKRTQEIAEYIREHFREPLTLDSLADHFHLSPTYFSRWFHRYFRMQLRDYLQRIRLREACNLLTTGNETINNIVEKSGFPNYNAMAKVFKRAYGKLPGEYRQNREFKESEEGMENFLSKNDISKLIQSLAAQSRITREARKNVISVDVNETIPLQHFWGQVLNCGRAADCLQADIQKDIAYLKECFGFQYLRVSDLLVRYLIPNKLLEDRFDYAMLYRLIGFMDSLGLKPIFDVAVKPDALGKAYYMEAPPYDDDDDLWLSHLQSFLEACRTHYPEEKLNEWKFEFWLPRIWEQSVAEEKIVNHAILVSKAQKLIRKFAPKAEIGGPGLRLIGNWELILKCWLGKLKELNILPDYLTFGLSAELRSSKAVGYYPSGSVTQFTLEKVYPLTAKDYMANWQRMQSIVEGILGKVPRTNITTVVPEPVCCPGLNDGAYLAAFLVKSIFDFASMGTGVFMPRFKNRDVDYRDENQLTCGGDGLLLRHQLKSTIYYAYSLLGHLGTSLVSKGENYLMTRDENGRIAVVFHNCKNHSSYFEKAFMEERDVDFTDPRLYEDNSVLDVSMQITGIEGGKYRIHQYLLSDNHGCIATELNRLDFYGVLTSDILSYLEKVTRPFQRFFKKECKDILDFSISLQPNDIMLLEIEKVPENGYAPVDFLYYN